MNRRNEYTDTVRDLKAMLRREADEEKRRALTENLDKMQTQIERQKDGLQDLAVLTERVKWLRWLVCGVVMLFAVQVGSAIVVALLLKGIAK